jgi:hypothetical protein
VDRKIPVYTANGPSCDVRMSLTSIAVRLAEAGAPLVAIDVGHQLPQSSTLCLAARSARSGLRIVDRARGEGAFSLGQASPFCWTGSLVEG